MRLGFVNYDESDLPGEFWSEISSAGAEAIFLPLDDLDDNISRLDGILLKLGLGLSASQIQKATSLKFIGMLGTGYGRIDTASARAAGIDVFNVSDYATQAVSELTLGAIISSLRDFEGARKQVRNGDFGEPQYIGSELASKRVGIVGVGDIGTSVALAIKGGFGAEVCYWSRSPKPSLEETGIQHWELDKLFSGSDIISLHLASNEQTDGIVSKEFIDMMPHGATLVNTSPMELINTSALKARLSKGEISFIMDHPDEIPEAEAKEYDSFASCFVYPPFGYLTEEAGRKKLEIFKDNVLAGINRTEMPNKVN